MSKLPPEEELIDDFNKLVKLYSFVLNEICDIELKENLKNTFETEDQFTDRVEEDNSYSDKNFLNEVYITEKEHETLKKLLKNKKNIIIQGPPGVGKTFMAKRLAYSIMGLKDDNNIEFVQFHQSYSYEDFVMGYKPTEEGFELKNGIFYEFCESAKENLDKKYFFIIDEINRGKLSKIFGELFMLIENDKRGPKYDTKLLYSDKTTSKRFYIPENLYIIGLMNTADRSIAMIDYALRRRFAFFDLKPGFKSKGFKEYQKTLNSAEFNKVVEEVEELNNEIEDDDSLDEGFKIGHSYLCDINPKEDKIEDRLEYIVNYELIPLINEYWFDNQKKRKKWSKRLQDAIGYNEG